ncbi:MAG: Fur family transcriptional regulator [Planctomycetota bacterium]
MNNAPEPVPGALSPELVERFRQICRDAGLKVTPQRLAIFSEVVAAADHPSAEEVHARITPRLPSLSLDTVYRTLGLLDECGVVATIEAPDGRSRYDGRLEPHHHLVCRECGRIVDFQWPTADRLSPPAETARWGEVERVQVELRGVCAECLERRDAEPSES